MDMVTDKAFAHLEKLFSWHSKYTGLTLGAFLSAGWLLHVVEILLGRKKKINVMCLTQCRNEKIQYKCLLLGVV